MKRWRIYLVLLVGATLLHIFPFQGTDVAKLLPVQAVWLAWEKGEVCLKTDTGNSGQGNTVQAALEDMKKTASGTIFLDTADYLIVKKGSEALLVQIYDILRPSCMVCAATELPDLEEVTAYLDVHEPSVTLRQCENGDSRLPILIEAEGGFKWRE